MKHLLLTIIAITFFTPLKAQKMKDYTIEIKLNTNTDTVWKTITNFEKFPSWNSVLSMKENESMKVGEKFRVTIHKPNGKSSSFKAKLLKVDKPNSFSARQIMLGKWFFSATHYFIIEKIDENHVLFKQHWKLTGIIAAIFKKQIHKELALFKVMNEELKKEVK